MSFLNSLWNEIIGFFWSQSIPYYFTKARLCTPIKLWRNRGFGAYQEEDPNLTIDYGITRPINSGSFVQVYFGEFIHLVKDVITAPGITNQLRYFFYPPGWSHESGHQTAKMIRKAYLTKNE